MAINSALQAILSEFSDTLTICYGDRYIGLWLYGSQFRGTAGPDSDIDLLLILRRMNRPGQEIDRIAEILADFNLRYDVLLSVLPVEEGTLENSGG